MPALVENMEETESDGKEKSYFEKPIPSYSRTPVVAVPEKIVLCIDVSQDAVFKSYASEESNGNPFFQLKKSLSCFVYTKSSLSSAHEFAVISLEPGDVKWVQDFSNNPDEVVNKINNLEPVCLGEEIDTDLTPVFKVMNQKIGSLPEVKVESVQYPTHVVRLILIYNSSYNIPLIDRSDELFNSLNSSPYFRWDVLYLHDAPSRSNKCQKIYDVLLSMSTSGSYVFECSRKIVGLFNNMSKFLAHPFQRYENPYGDS